MIKSAKQALIRVDKQYWQISNMIDGSVRLDGPN